jgi:cytochrome c oxidase cbb3-type subunit 2
MKGIILLLILTGASSTQSISGPPARSVFADAPESARSARNPLASDVDASKDGMKLFEQHCAMCHGATGGGSKVAPALINGDIQAATPGEVFWVISNGVSLYGMPSWSKLTETQRWQIVAFLKSLNASQHAVPGQGIAKGAVWSQSKALPIISRVPAVARAKCNPLANDARATVAGRKLFQQHCAQCHGKAAEGHRKAPALISAEMMLATPGEIYWVITNGVVRHGMPSWSKLPELQRWQIVTFLESLRQTTTP